VDTFSLIITGIVVALILWVLFLGRYHPRSATDVLDWKPTRSPEVEVQNEIDDLDQMLAATNEKRRRRGEVELTEAMLEERVREDRRQAAEIREAYLEDRDLQQMLDATNERRRKRGEAELTEEEYRARVESEREG
jgi:hypothetical protein